MPWTNEEVLVLIAEYEQRPVLWNAFLDGYKDRALKADTWAELAYIMQKDRHEVEKKVHALRVQFNEELRKLEKKRLAYGSDELPRSAWQYFDALSFIVAGCKKKKVNPHAKIMVPILPKPSDGSQPLSFEEQAVALALTTSAGTIPHDTSTSTTPHSTSTSALLTGTSMLSAKDTASVLAAQRKLPFDPRVRKHILERVFDTANKPKIDEYNAFSAYVASEFRALKSETVKKRLKRSILCALMRASEEDDAEKNFPAQPPSQFYDAQNTISSVPSPRESSSPTTSIDDHHMLGMQSMTNQMVGVIDNVLRNGGRTEERPEEPSNAASEPYMSPGIKKEDMEEFMDDDKSREGAQSPDFPGVHVTLNEGPLPERKRRRTQYGDVQSSNRSPHNTYNDDVKEHESDEEEDLFGRYVAATIKKFPRRAKSVAKMRIQHVLYETEEVDRMGKEYSLNISVNNGN